MQLTDDYHTFAIIFTASLEQKGILLALTILFALTKLHPLVVPLSAIPLPLHSCPKATPGDMLASQDKMHMVVGLYSWMWCSFVVHTFLHTGESDDCNAPASAQRGGTMEISC